MVGGGQERSGGESGAEVRRWVRRGGQEKVKRVKEEGIGSGMRDERKTEKCVSLSYCLFYWHHTYKRRYLGLNEIVHL